MAALVLAVSCTASDAAPHSPAPTPAVGQDAPDPEVLVVGDTWYLFSTNARVGDDAPNVPVRASTDRGRTWGPTGDALPTVGAWAVPGWTWAPATYQPTFGTYVLYYTARDRVRGVQCIGVATAIEPAGPYVDDRQHPLVCQPELGGSIDPDAYRTDDGAAYLTWKSDGNNPEVGKAPVLWSQPLADSGLELGGSPTPLLAGSPGLDGIVENPSLVTTPSGVALLYSSGWWESDGYRMRLAQCESPSGPCSESPWEPPESRRGGGGSTFTDGRRTYIAYHEWAGPYSYAEGGIRVAEVDRLLPWVVGASDERAGDITPPPAGGMQA